MDAHIPIDVDQNLSRRDLAKLAAIGALGAALATGEAAALEVSALDKTTLQTLVERIVNSRYQVDSQGYITLSGEIWSGDDGSLKHQDWLFNGTDGLKTNARAALSKAVVDGNHEGVDSGQSASAIDSIMSTSDALGILGEDNLIYHALRVKMAHNWEHGFDAALDGFRDWLGRSDEISSEVKALIAAKLAEFRSRPVAKESHAW